MQYVNLDSIAREFEGGRTFFNAGRAFRNLLDVVAWHEPLESESRFTSLDLAGVLSTLEDFSTYAELAAIRANDFNPLEDAGFLRVTEQGSVQFLLDSEVKPWMVNAHDRRETVLLAAEVDRKGRVYLKTFQTDRRAQALRFFQSSWSARRSVGLFSSICKVQF